MDALTPERTTEQVEALTDAAYAAGVAHGTAAATWYFPREARDDLYWIVLRGIRDGDPRVLDTFPGNPLSGEWADEPTPGTLADRLHLDADDDLMPTICGFYEDGYGVAFSMEVERQCIVHLGLGEGC